MYIKLTKQQATKLVCGPSLNLKGENLLPTGAKLILEDYPPLTPNLRLWKVVGYHYNGNDLVPYTKYR
jgi:hypothetical protein